MPASWKFFKVICVLQSILAGFYAMGNLISLFKYNDLYYLMACGFYVLIIWLAFLALTTLTNNYPDIPIVGSQKQKFNWLFLLNFLLLAFLFAAVIAEYYKYREVMSMTGLDTASLPLSFLIDPIAHICVLIFQFVILYGLYVLRRTIYRNFNRKTFEFENSSRA